MSEPSDLGERLRRGAGTIHPSDPPIERILARGRQRRVRTITVGIGVGVVLAAAVLGPLIALSRLDGGHQDQVPSEPAVVRGPLRVGVGHGAVLTAPSDLSLLVWGEAGRFWPEGAPGSQPLFQLTNVDPGLFVASDPTDAWWCPVNDHLPAEAAILLVRVTAVTGADHTVPAWPVALDAGSNACGDGLTATWRIGESSFDALVAFGEGATDADRQAVEDAFSSMRFDDEPRWFAITGFEAGAKQAPMQIIDGGFLRGTPWLHIVYPDHQGSWLCMGTLYPRDVPADSTEALGEPPDVSCGQAMAGEQAVWASGAACEHFGDDHLLTNLSGYASAEVTSIVIEMDDGDRWETRPVTPPPGVDLAGARLWVAPALTGVKGVAIAYNDAGEQVGRMTVDACEGLAD